MVSCVVIEKYGVVEIWCSSCVVIEKYGVVAV